MSLVYTRTALELVRRAVLRGQQSIPECLIKSASTDCPNPNGSESMEDYRKAIQYAEKHDLKVVKFDSERGEGMVDFILFTGASLALVALFLGPIWAYVMAVWVRIADILMSI